MQAVPCGILGTGIVHIVITDSGLGGLSVCAVVARASLEAEAGARLTYVNAWPELGRGYNDLPDMPAQARMFDRVLRSVMSLEPDEIVIACNTLSIVYDWTEFRAREPVPVRGIIDAGIELFHETLAASPGSPIVLIGTRTTITSGVHRYRLAASGIAEERIGAAACHGLAAAIERDPNGADTSRLIDECTSRAAEALPPGDPAYVGFCCTHYAFVGPGIRDALAARTGRRVVPLDPNARLAGEVSSHIRSEAPTGRLTVEVLSKVPLEDRSRGSLAGLIAPVSSETAAALRAYRHIPDLF